MLTLEFEVEVEVEVVPMPLWKAGVWNGGKAPIAAESGTGDPKKNSTKRRFRAVDFFFGLVVFTGAGDKGKADDSFDGCASALKGLCTISCFFINELSVRLAEDEQDVLRLKNWDDKSGLDRGGA
eukprot:TRINITY_DN941_c0_g1_i2.p2 TRINITY_DN941_c0_g1~~TRINITY_DN941_c0_g1_i2.p2  ORF type:complete len:125 (+),score=24.53 TRINITY_DN941_c0_g1_i2:215-589(+)